MITSVVITHSMKTVYNVVDRVLMLQCGTIKFDGTPDDIKRCEDESVSMFVQGNSGIE